LQVSPSLFTDCLPSSGSGTAHPKEETKEITKAVSLEGGRLNVRRKNNVGNTSDRRFHDVYFNILFRLIHRNLFRKNHLLQKTMQNQTG
jgi:hypothetical protein